MSVGPLTVIKGKICLCSGVRELCFPNNDCTLLSLLVELERGVDGAFFPLPFPALSFSFVLETGDTLELLGTPLLASKEIRVSIFALCSASFLRFCRFVFLTIFLILRKLENSLFSLFC